MEPSQTSRRQAVLLACGRYPPDCMFANVLLLLPDMLSYAPQDSFQQRDAWPAIDA